MQAPDQKAPADTPQFNIEQLYLKDLSFESPNTPGGVDHTQEPKTTFNLDSQTNRLNDDHFEVVLNVSVKVTAGDKTMFLCEIAYGGVFLLKNIPNEHLPMVLGIECPGVIYPYVREIVNHSVISGGFRPIHLGPINFAQLFQESQARRQQEAAAAQGAPN